MEILLRIGSYMLLMGAMRYIMNKAGIKGGGCCGGHSHSEHNNQSHGSTGQTGNGVNDKNRIDMAIDPVCGMYVNPESAVKQNLDGTTYNFCSESCRRSFFDNYYKTS